MSIFLSVYKNNKYKREKTSWGFETRIRQLLFNTFLPDFSRFSLQYHNMKLKLTAWAPVICSGLTLNPEFRRILAPFLRYQSEGVK